ncbi:MAG: stage V sporulation protein AC [Clostridia bacterium]
MASQKAKKQVANLPHMTQTSQEDKRRQLAYKELVQRRKPKPRYLRNLLVAFVVGGAIAVLGQVILSFFMSRGLDLDSASAPTLATMILVGVVATGLGIYDELGEFAGAGAAVPITGFANTIVAAAMDFKREGWVLGMGAKMFIIAGPVIVYATLAGVAVAFIKFVAAS